MKWSNELSVGIYSIDKQHMKLVGILNNFSDKIRQDSGRVRTMEAIKGLKDYTVLHFTDEEKLMQVNSYPGYEQHKKEHDAFIKTVLDYEDRFSKGKMLLSIEIVNFINEWVAKHIMEIDKKYSVYLISRGVK